MQSWKGLQKIELQFIYVNEKGKKKFIVFRFEHKKGKKIIVFRFEH